MIDIRQKEDCCGCAACLQRCPKQCISLHEDSEGFLYPRVNVEQCVSCGICEKACPVLNQAEARFPLKVYAAKNNNEQELLMSSSGGLFIVFAKKIIKDGGVVFGARFDENWNVLHSYADTEEGIMDFIGSKYVQSRVGDSYAEARAFLKSGRIVLFTGTSCQIAGLKTFLGRDYDNLLTIDVICHGVPSPLVWKRYLTDITNNVINAKSISQTTDSLIKSISFRDKHTGWKNYSFTLSIFESQSRGFTNNWTLSHTFTKDPFMQLFLGNMTIRPSCYHCPSKNGRSKSDLTIADFWGIEKIWPDFDDNKGVGLLMVNTEKGQCAIDDKSLSLLEVSLSDATRCNLSYYQSVSKPLERGLCFWLINKKSWSINDIAQLFQRIASIRNIKNRLKSKIRCVLKK